MRSVLRIVLPMLAGAVLLYTGMQILQASPDDLISGKERPPLPCMDESLKGKTFYATGDQVRMRTYPDASDSTTIIPNLRLMKNDTVKLLRKSCQRFTIGQKTGSWHEVLHPSGQVGWVFYYLELQPELPPPPPLPRCRFVEQSGAVASALRSAGDWYDKNFGNTHQKSLMQLVEASNYTDPIVRSLAGREAVKMRAAGAFNLGQVCNLHDYALKKWGYVNDPARVEYVAKASETIQNQKTGDCDDFAVLMYSLVSAIGGDARISYACNDYGCHAFAEVYIGDGESLPEIRNYLAIRYGCSPTEIEGFRAENGRVWMNLDWFGQPKHPAGIYFNWDEGVAFYLYNRQYQPFQRSEML